MFLNSEILSPKLLRLYKNSDKFQMEVRLYKNNSSVYTKLYAFIWQCMQCMQGMVVDFHGNQHLLVSVLIAAS